MEKSNPIIAVAQTPPFEVQALVFEEDTYLVLSAGNHIRNIREPLEELQNEAIAQQPLQLGDLVTRGSKMFAIVHDFDRATPFSSEALGTVLEKLANHVEKFGIVSIGVQPLGSHHGPLAQEEVIGLIESVSWPESLERIWVMNNE